MEQFDSNCQNNWINSQQKWHQFIDENRRIIAICHHIEELSQYWRLFLTVSSLQNITLQCYMTYVTFFGDVPFNLRYLFLYGDIEFNIRLFLVIDSCAKVVRMNRRFEIENRKLYLLFIKKKAIDRRNVQNYLKVFITEVKKEG